jgi:hypothetical protein
MKIAAVLILIFCLKCTPNRHIFIAETYSPRLNSNVAFIPLTREEIILHSPKQIEEAFKEDRRGASRIITDTGNTQIKKALADSLKGVTFSFSTRIDSLGLSVQDDRYFKDALRKVGKDSIPIAFRIPRKTIFDSLDPGNDVYFIITSIQFEKYPNAGFTSNRTEPGSDERCYANNDPPAHYLMGMNRTGFITSGVGPSPSEERRAKENEAAIVAGTTCRASWRSTWRHMQFDEGCAFRSRAKPEWSYETSSSFRGSSYSLNPTFQPPVSFPMHQFPLMQQPEKVKVRVRFAVWDKTIDSVVSCGEVIKKTGTVYRTDKHAWRSIFRYIGFTMATYSPFVRMRFKAN